MSVYSEWVNESGIDPRELDRKITEGILADPPQPWNLPSADVLGLWGDMNLRTMFAIMSGGESPTTFTGGMAKMVRAMTDPSSLLGLHEPPVQADYTRALQVVEALKSRARAVDGEVIDG